jgi:hypothetical protein
MVTDSSTGRRWGQKRSFLSEVMSSALADETFSTFVRYSYGTDMKQVYYFFADASRIALQSIFAQKLRTFLTLIGIIIAWRLWWW